MRSLSLPSRFLCLAVLLGWLGHSAFAKTIQAIPDVPVIAETTWYFVNCTTSAGLGSYSINVAPTHGTVTFADVSGPVPGCPEGSPSLPAVQAYYTWTDTATTAPSDFFELYYNLNGSVAAVLDVDVILNSCPAADEEASLLSKPQKVEDGAFITSKTGALSTKSSNVIAASPSCTPPPPYDCSKDISVIPDNFVITPNHTLTAEFGDAFLLPDTPYEYIYSGARWGGTGKYTGVDGYPRAIFIDALSKNGLIRRAGSPTINIVYTQNMTLNTGKSFYGTERLEEYQALPDIEPPKRILDVVDASKTLQQTQAYDDSPWIHIPLEDKDHRLLQEVRYAKGFRTYVGCNTPTDATFHPLATVDWQVNYSGKVQVPKPFFYPLFRFTTFQQIGIDVTPGPAIENRTEQPVLTGPNANDTTTYAPF